MHSFLILSLCFMSLFVCVCVCVCGSILNNANNANNSGIGLDTEMTLTFKKHNI